MIKQKILGGLMLVALLFSPALARAETAATATFDLEVVDVGYDTATGHPTKVSIKNVGTANFSGRIYLIVSLVDANGGRLHESVGALSYGTDIYYQDVFTDVAIASNQIYLSPLSKGWNYRHREAVKVKVELRADNDPNTANNTKIFDLPMPDLYIREAYVKKQDSSPVSWADQYIVYYQIVNGGLAGYVGGATLAEPNHNIKVKYEDGSESSFGNDLSYFLTEKIGPGGISKKERQIQVDNRKTPKDLIITVDPENRIVEGNDSNNVLTQAFSISTPPDNSAFLARGQDKVIGQFQDDVKKLGLNDKSKLLGLEVKPCSALSGLKDFKDNISAGLTFNKEKKTTKKIKQTAQKVLAMNNGKDKLAKDAKCLEESLSDYKDSQVEITKSLNALNKSDKDQAAKLSTLALTSGLNEMKVVNLLATASTASETKSKSEAISKEVVSTLAENSKMITDKTALKTAFSDSFDSGDSVQMALLNLDMLNSFKGLIEGFSAFLIDLQKENALDMKLDIADLGQDQLKEMNEFMQELSFETDAPTEDNQVNGESDAELAGLFDNYVEEEATYLAEPETDESSANDSESGNSMTGALERSDSMTSGNDTNESASDAASAQFDGTEDDGGSVDSGSTDNGDSVTDAPTSTEDSSDN